MSTTLDSEAIKALMAEWAGDAEVEQLTKILDELREVASAAYNANSGRIGTHYEDCWKYHAGCLAALVKDILDE